MRIVLQITGCLLLLLPALVLGSEPENSTPWVLDSKELQIMAAGMIFAFAIYNLCTFSRQFRRQHSYYCLSGFFLGFYLLSHNQALPDETTYDLIASAFSSQMLLICATITAIQFQLTLLPVRSYQPEKSSLNAGRWLLIILALLTVINIPPLSATVNFWPIIPVTLFTAVFGFISLRMMQSGVPVAVYFVTGWFSLAFGLLGSEIAGRYGQNETSPLWTALFPISLSIGAVIQSIANSLALSAYSNHRFRMYQEGYEMMESNLQRQHNQRRVYNEAVRQYLHNLPSMDEKSVAIRLLEVLTDLLPLESSSVAIYRDKKLKFISQTLSEQNYFERLLDSHTPLLTNMARHGRVTTMPPMNDTEKDEPITLHVIPVHFEPGAWIMVFMQTQPSHELEADHLQLSMDISNHACTLFMASSNYRKLQDEADADSLTGILNRRAFLREASAVVRRLQEQGQNLGLLYLDLDRFKPLNDNHGHAFGDHVLRQFAEVCQDNLRERDLLARVGGEEFVVLLPQADLQAAVSIAERIRESVAGLNFPELGTQHVTVSTGIADGASCGYDLRQLMARADDALYQAKKSGRNRTVTISSTSDTRVIKQND